MDAKPCQIPIVQIRIVEVHLFFSAVPRKTVRVGVEWAGGKAEKHSNSNMQTSINRERPRQNVKKRGAMTEVKGMLELCCVPPSPSNKDLFLFSPYFSSTPPFPTQLRLAIFLCNLQISFTLL